MLVISQNTMRALVTATLLVSYCHAFLTKTPVILRTPDTTFSKLSSIGYPWQPKYSSMSLANYPELRVHYIDEGPTTATETVLLLHGTPTWSFLWREMIPTLLLEGYRVVAPDFIGCGRSDKLSDRTQYNHNLHVKTLEHIIKELNLEDITLIGHDLGGPIGGSVVRKDGSNFKRIGLFNTWFPQGDVFSSAEKITQYIPYLAFRVMTQLLGPYHPVAAIFVSSSTASIAEVLHGYMAPFPDYRYKAGISVWPPMIPLNPDEPLAVEMQQVAQFFRSDWGSKPAMVGYSSEELVTRPGQQLLEDVFASCCKPTITNAGHFLQEDQPEQMARAVISLVKENC